MMDEMRTEIMEDDANHYAKERHMFESGEVQ